LLLAAAPESSGAFPVTAATKIDGDEQKNIAQSKSSSFVLLFGKFS